MRKEILIDGKWVDLWAAFEDRGTWTDGQAFICIGDEWVRCPEFDFPWASE